MSLEKRTGIDCPELVFFRGLRRDFHMDTPNLIGYNRRPLTSPSDNSNDNNSKPFLIPNESPVRIGTKS